MIVENIEQYQPRFREWLRSLNAKKGDEVKMIDYMSWVRKEWDKEMNAIDERNEIRRMKAGKELDSMVHEAFHPGTLFLWKEGYSNYSTDLNQAWIIANRVPLWRMVFAYHADFTVSLSFKSPNTGDFVEADTPAEALCKAALICKVRERSKEGTNNG